MRRIVLVVLLLSATAWARGSAWRKLGDAGTHGDARAVTLAGAALYSVDSAGALHATDLGDGSRASRGAADFADTRLLFGDSTRLIALADGGALYEVDGGTGAWRQIGERCAWSDTVAGAILGGRLYTIESSGELYATDLGTGNWRQVGDASYPDVTMLLAGGDALYVLDRAGNLDRVDPATAARSAIGDRAAWEGTVAAALAGNALYSVDATGAVRVTDVARGSSRTLEGTIAATALFAPGGKLLYALDGAGTLRRLKL